ncbi:MAG: hypothetical protein U9O98_08175 [Asgard group archaeon]|nr:hypothetical protein [Asgard group archaeon]
MNNKKQKRTKTQNDYQKISSEETINGERKHPELQRDITKKEETTKFRPHRRISPTIVKWLNQQRITNIILTVAVILGILYIGIGITSIIGFFGAQENPWVFYEATSFLGWNKITVTGFALLIAGIVIIWSVPYYFFNKSQVADSYLLVGTTIGILFGLIYIIIILADILNGLVIALANQSAIEIVTYFYLPIPLAITTIPIFRVLTIRHHIILMDEVELEENGKKEKPITLKQLIKQRNQQPYRKRWPKKTNRKHYRRKMRRWHKKPWRRWSDEEE